MGNKLVPPEARKMGNPPKKLLANLYGESVNYNPWTSSLVL